LPLPLLLLLAVVVLVVLVVVVLVGGVLLLLLGLSREEGAGCGAGLACGSEELRWGRDGEEGGSCGCGGKKGGDTCVLGCRPLSHAAACAMQLLLRLTDLDEQLTQMPAALPGTLVRLCSLAGNDVDGAKAAEQRVRQRSTAVLRLCCHCCVHAAVVLDGSSCGASLCCVAGQE